MTRREAFRAIVNHQTPDRVLLDLGGCPLSGLSPEAAASLFHHLGYRCDYTLGLTPFGQFGQVAHRGAYGMLLEKLYTDLDIDTRGVGDIYTPEKSVFRQLSDTAYIDEWGVERRFTGLYWDIVNAPLAELETYDLDDYPWPDPLSLPQEEIDAAVARAKYFHEETDYVVCASHPVYGIFELGCWMCGFEEFMVRMLIDKPFVHRFFEIILDYQKKAIRRYYEPLAPYIDFTTSGDDFATQSDLFFSPALFGELVAPYFKERIAYTKQFTDAPFLHHSCGNVARLIPQLIECGVDILNPIQPTGASMQPAHLKSAFGKEIVFHGGLDTQAVLPNGTRETVTKAVGDLLSVMQPGGGYIFAAAHNLQGDVPPENIITMFKAARAWKKV